MTKTKPKTTNLSPQKLGQIASKLGVTKINTENIDNLYGTIQKQLKSSNLPEPKDYSKPGVSCKGANVSLKNIKKSQSPLARLASSKTTSKKPKSPKRKKSLSPKSSSKVSSPISKSKRKKKDKKKVSNKKLKSQCKCVINVASKNTLTCNRSKKWNGTSCINPYKTCNISPRQFASSCNVDIHKLSPVQLRALAALKNLHITVNTKLEDIVSELNKHFIKRKSFKKR